MLRPILAILLSILVLNSCLQNSLTPEFSSSLKQVGKCAGNPLYKSLASTDSLFQYTFNKDLIIDFYVTGNCCPDSNRFECSSFHKEDSLIVYIKDIEENLCKCICKYKIHGEYKNITKDFITVKCIMKEKEGNRVLFIQSVKRNFSQS